MNRPTVPAWVRWLTVLAVLVVAAVAALVSYSHMRAVGERVGEGWAALLPPSVDGLIVAASLVMFVRRRAGLPAGALPWSGLVLGLLASVAANVAAAHPTVLGRATALWPPLAFGLSFELLVMLLRDGATHGVLAGAERAGDALADPAPGDDTPVATLDDHGLSRLWQTAPPAGATAGGDVAGPGDGKAVSKDTAAATPGELIASGRGRRRLAQALGVPEHHARALLDQHRANGRAGVAT